MSASESHGRPVDPDAELVPRPEDERLPVGKIAAVALVSLVAFALGILWAVQIMVSERGTVINVSAPAPYIGQAEIGIVDHSLFELENRASRMQQDKAQRLNSYGWVSRKEQLIHIPIEEAMKAVAAGRRPPGSNAQGALQLQHPGTLSNDGGMPQDPQGGAQGPHGAPDAGAGTGAGPSQPSTTP